METVGTVHERKETVFEWSIPNFLSLSEERGVSYFSPLFFFHKASWCIELFPNGVKKKHSNTLMHLFLHRKTSGPPIEIEWYFGIKNAKRNRCLYGYTRYDFNRIEHKRSMFYLSRDQILENKSDILPSDTLTLLCCIKHPQSTEFSVGKEVTTKSSNIFHVNKVLQDLKQLFLKQKDCDVVLKVREQEFSAHRSILAARSPVFESTFRSDMKERQTGMVDIEDCDPSSFSDFLCFLYCGEIETLSEENVFCLFTTADKYDVQDLREICMEFMKENISVDTFCDTITLALQHSEAELIRLATEFFTKNSLKIVKTVPWQKFAAENPIQSNELVIKTLEAASNSNEGFIFPTNDIENINGNREKMAHVLFILCLCVFLILMDAIC